MQPLGKQLELNEDDGRELQTLIERHWTSGSQDLQDRGRANARRERLWRNMPEPGTDPDASNFQIPLVPWQILNSVAKEIAALFGEDSEVMVTPLGKTDSSRVDKIARWMNYRVRELDLLRKCYDFAVMRKIFGTAIVYTQWQERKRTVIDLVPETTEIFQTQTDPVTGLAIQVPVPQTTVKPDEHEVTDFLGLDIKIEDIEDWVVPVSAVSLDDAEYFIRRLRLTVDEILDLKDQGKLDAKLFDAKFVDDLYRRADTSKDGSSAQPDAGAPVKDAKDEAAGLPSVPSGPESKLTILNWFGKFRLRDKRGKRKERAERVVAFYSPDHSKVLGVCRLVDIFPDGRLPFVKDDTIRDPNRFWGVGFAELLEPINLEMNAIHNITTDAGLNAVSPMVGYKPMSGCDPKKFKSEPNLWVPLNDPKNDASVINTANVNMAPYVALMPQLLAMAERLTGLTDPQMGRQFSGPNAPRTLGQQEMLQQESNQRIFLDVKMQRAAYKEILQRIWEADKRWLPESYFLRVAEASGMDVLTKEDMIGDYDFDIGPETAFMNRATVTNELLQAMSIAQMSPIIQQHPEIQVLLLGKVLDRLHLPDVSAKLPDVSSMEPPQSAEAENTRMLQGEDVNPHPQDNHVRHIQVHQDLYDRLSQWNQEIPNVLGVLGAVSVPAGIKSHIEEHKQAMKTQGASLNMMGQQPGSAMMAGGPSTQLPQSPSLGPMGLGGAAGGSGGSNPPASPIASNLASMLNSGGMNNG